VNVRPRRLALALVLVGLPAACSAESTASDGKLAALRFVIAQLPEANRAAPLHVILDDAPPSEAFLQRLARTGVSARAATAATHDFAKRVPLPGMPADTVTVWAADFDQWAEHGATVRAGHYGSEGLGVEFALDLRREAGEWVVKE